MTYYIAGAATGILVSIVTAEPGQRYSACEFATKGVLYATAVVLLHGVSFLGGHLISDKMDKKSYLDGVTIGTPASFLSPYAPSEFASLGMLTHGLRNSKSLSERVSLVFGFCQGYILMQGLTIAIQKSPYPLATAHGMAGSFIGLFCEMARYKDVKLIF